MRPPLLGAGAAKRGFVAPTALLVLTLLAYFPAYRAGFIWDDNVYVTNNPALRSAEGLGRIWTDPQLIRQYYPVTLSTFWVEHQLVGNNPALYHATNVVLHALNAIALRSVLGLVGIPGATLTAALFALHPVHVESVAWVTERKNVLSAFLYLLSAFFFLRVRLRDGVSGSRAPRFEYTFSLLAYVAALLSKSVTCSLPVALFLTLWWKRGRILRKDAVLLTPFLALGLLLGLLTVHFERAYVGAQGGEWSFSIAEKIVLAGKIFWFYLGKLAWPHPLVFIYPRWKTPFASWSGLYPAAALGAIAAAWFFRRRLGRGPATAALFFLCTLVPALGFFHVYPMRFSFVADHFQYLASIGVLALAGALASRGPAAARAILAALVIVFGVFTYQQARIYRDAETLWSVTIESNPDAWLARVNLGDLLMRRGKVDEAIEQLEAALRTEPRETTSLKNLAWIRAAFPEPEYRDPAAALTMAREACVLTHYKDPAALDILAAALAANGRFDEAITTGARALQIAVTHGRSRLAGEIEARLALYRSGQPAWAAP